MEIGPIIGIRAFPFLKSPPPDADLSAVFDIENTARTGDETYSSSNQESARGAEDDGPEDDALEDDFGSLSGDDQAEAPSSPVSKTLSRQISFFA
jgi:hypothetical protein